jgi:autotransporter-associated beta strand protein
MSVAAADWTGSDLTIGHTGDVGSDTYLNAYSTGSTPPAGNVVPAQLAENVSKLQISFPNNAADAVTIDCSGVNPVIPIIPPDGVTFNGGSGTATSTVNVSGSSDLSGTMQITGSVTLGSGSLTSGTPSSSPFSIESGTIATNLTGTGGLTKTGPGTATVSGSNSYQGDTTITAGTLDVTTSTALPVGTALTVGAGGVFVFGPAVESSPVSSSSIAVVGPVPAAANGPVSSAPAVPVDVPVAAPLSAQALVTDSTTAAAFLPMARPAATPFHLAAASLCRSYDRSTGPTVVHVPRVAGYLAWWNSSAAANSGDSTETDRRLAALDAVLAQYGSP